MPLKKLGGNKHPRARKKPFLRKKLSFQTLSLMIFRIPLSLITLWKGRWLFLTVSTAPMDKTNWVLNLFATGASFHPDPLENFQIQITFGFWGFLPSCAKKLLLANLQKTRRSLKKTQNNYLYSVIKAQMKIQNFLYFTKTPFYIKIGSCVSFSLKWSQKKNFYPKKRRGPFSSPLFLQPF